MAVQILEGSGPWEWLMSSSESEQGGGGALTGMVRMGPNLWLLTAFRTCSSLANDRVPKRAWPGVSPRPFRILQESDSTELEAEVMMATVLPYISLH